MSWQGTLFRFFNDGLLLYSIVLLGFQFFIGIYAIGGIRRYLRSNRFTDYRVLAASQNAPGISILAPAYNEAATVVENVRSLLSIHYNNLEVIIINDGSKDESLNKLITEYSLRKIDFFVNEQIKAKKVRGVYKSDNPVFHKLGRSRQGEWREGGCAQCGDPISPVSPILFASTWIASWSRTRRC